LYKGRSGASRRARCHLGETLTTPFLALQFKYLRPWLWRTRELGRRLEGNDVKPRGLCKTVLTDAKKAAIQAYIASEPWMATIQPGFRPGEDPTSALRIRKL